MTIIRFAQKYPPDKGEGLPALKNRRKSLDRYTALGKNRYSGDINNIDRLNPRPGKGPYQRMREVAEDLAAKVNAALAEMSWQGSAPLAARFSEPQIAWREVGPDLLAWAADVEAQTPRVPGGNIPVGAKWATTREFAGRLSYAGRVQSLAQTAEPALVPLQVLRIGDVGIGTSPCETFAEIGLEFKRRSPLPHSFMVSLAHGYIGYLPTPRHFELGGYETWPGRNYLEPQASEKILDALMEMAAEIAPHRGEKK